MAKSMKTFSYVFSKLTPRRSIDLSSNSVRCMAMANTSTAQTQQIVIASQSLAASFSRRNHSTLTVPRLRHGIGCKCIPCSLNSNKLFFSTEVDKDLSQFLDKEITFEVSKSSKDLPKIPGFEITTDGGDVTLTKSTGSEKIVIRLSINGAVDSMVSEEEPEKQDQPPQIVCRPPFEVEITKGDGAVLAFQCGFPPVDESFEDAAEYGGKGQDQEQKDIDDQFEIQEVTIHQGEWKNSTFSVSAATLDAELFDLLMDMLDERGINDEFIAQLVDYCTAYENKRYIVFLKDLKSFTEK